MNILFATVYDFDTKGNTFLKPHFEFNLAKHYRLIIPGHELDLITSKKPKIICIGEPYFYFSQNKLSVCIKNGNAKKNLLLWKGRIVRIIETSK